MLRRAAISLPAAVAACLACAVPAGASTSTKPPVPTYVTGEPSYAPLLPNGVTIGSSVASPSTFAPGCSDKAAGEGLFSYQPGEYEGLAQALSYVYCAYTESEVYVNSDLYRDRWYGLQYLADDPVYEYDSNAAESTANWECLGVGTYTYYNDGYASVTEGGTEYTGSDAASARFNC